MTILLEARHLFRHYGPLQAVSDLCFSISSGQIIGFLGQNGAGKSTTMQMLAGVLSSSSGEIRIGEFDLRMQPVAARRLIGYLPERPPLYSDMSVQSYLHFCARLRQLPARHCHAAVDTVLQQCDLTTVRKRLIGNLSKGFQQRVGIAQAIVHDPLVVILDEPTVGLDPLQIREIRSLIQQLGQERTVILSTHLLPEVQSVCTHVHILHHGKLVLQQKLAELTQQAPQMLRLCCRRPPDDAQLRIISGVQQTNWLSREIVHIHYSPDCDPTPELLQKAVAEQWDLYELIPQGQSLEQIFIALTCADM